MPEYIVIDVYDKYGYVGRGYNGELVRCRDCIFHKEKRCTVWRERAVIVECYTDDDGYCYKGARKEE